MSDDAGHGLVGNTAAVRLGKILPYSLIVLVEPCDLPRPISFGNVEVLGQCSDHDGRSIERARDGKAHDEGGRGGARRQMEDHAVESGDVDARRRQGGEASHEEGRVVLTVTTRCIVPATFKGVGKDHDEVPLLGKLRKAEGAEEALGGLWPGVVTKYHQNLRLLRVRTARTGDIDEHAAVDALDDVHAVLGTESSGSGSADRLLHERARKGRRLYERVQVVSHRSSFPRARSSLAATDLHEREGRLKTLMNSQVALASSSYAP